MRKTGPLFVVPAFILLLLLEILSAPFCTILNKILKDKEVMRSIRLTVYSAGLAALISFVFGTPLAFLLARTDFIGKHLVESIIDLPIVIPHPVVGIALLSVAGKNHWISQIFSELGIRMMESVTGIVTVHTFVGLPFYVNATKNGFENISPRLENVSRSLGVPIFSTFFRVTFPLAWRSMLIGIICAVPGQSVNSALSLSLPTIR
jgi:molybdate/tungstate transport system permease protein